MHAAIASPAALAILASLRLRAAPAPEPTPRGAVGYNFDAARCAWDEYFDGRARGRSSMVAREAILQPMREALRAARRGRLSS